MTSIMDHEVLAKSFATGYFSDAQNDVKELHRRYRPDSLLSIDGTKCTGADKIGEKLAWFFEDTKTQNISTVSLPFGRDILMVVTGTMRSGSELGIPVSHTILLKSETMTVYIQYHIIAMIT
ncbi:hypothetical protein BGZ96_002562 [Linnemannia gamsii]|uniref:Nuclear transport factor 2 domain-containing protein n=1 Tax=Linnemannia gamsii TaxID=64522 RepID=A0ABQ7K7W2_9FUNG|nr:hypothetical protein BGZ96_002562 [Linnemannia gamsii]